MFVIRRRIQENNITLKDVDKEPWKLPVGGAAGYELAHTTQANVCAAHISYEII